MRLEPPMRSSVRPISLFTRVLVDMAPWLPAAKATQAHHDIRKDKSVSEVIGRAMSQKCVNVSVLSLLVVVVTMHDIVRSEDACQHMYKVEEPSEGYGME